MGMPSPPPAYGPLRDTLLRVDELTGTIIGRFRVGGRMQVLPYAAVHRATLITDETPVLLWSFREPYSQAMGFLEALQRLAGDRRAASVNGIAQVLEIGTQDEPTPLVYLATEDAGRGFLVSLLQAGRAPGVLATAAALAQAVDGLHSNGLLHGDIQPATVAVDSNGRPLLVGHGIRTVVTRVNPRAAWIDMTRGFRPPETQHPLQPTRAGDIYGLAALTYYLLVGKPPDADGRIAPPSAIRPQLPSTIDAAVMRGLSSDPSQRFTTAAAFVSALRPAPRKTTTGRPNPPVAAPAARAVPATSEEPARAPVAGSTQAPPFSPVPSSEARSTPTSRSALGERHRWEEDSSWVTSGTQEVSRPSTNLISLVPLEPYEMEPQIRRRSGIVLLLALIVLALVLLVLSATGRLYL